MTQWYSSNLGAWVRDFKSQYNKSVAHLSYNSENAAELTSCKFCAESFRNDKHDKPQFGDLARIIGAECSWNSVQR